MDERKVSNYIFSVIASHAFGLAGTEQPKQSLIGGDHFACLCVARRQVVHFSLRNVDAFFQDFRSSTI